MDKKKVLTDKVIDKINDVIDALKEIEVKDAEERRIVESRIAVLEWLKSGQPGKVVVGNPPEKK